METGAGTPKKTRGKSRNLRQKEKMQKLQDLAKGRAPAPAIATGAATGQPPPTGATRPGGKAGGKGGKGLRIPDDEYKVIMGLKSKNGAGKPLCRFYASSVGCPRPDCTFAHEFPVCGQAHAWAQFHK